ncbi:hypothetical protein GJV26_00030 [Massilia dura]|uniref:Plasmid replication protein RepL domain-containing protein n=1 Tax=Pseudoduganella dura TaxID=321982 RepID=A0A6I3X1W6_9BURK|nr:hypothetical protein [Pseudoduganella dura]MUI10884.1 hypothetical protein [Pseudoduganella dura]GGY12722.1 hypothetical protein GCM10007386_48760 [Pseudoduganella dura]
MAQKREHNVSGARTGPSLKSLTYSADHNPLLEQNAIEIKKRKVQTGIREEFTGDGGTRISAIHEIIEKDETEFVKVFADGVKAAFGLSRTAYRVFQLVLQKYQDEPMVGGYADSVYLAWFNGGLSGVDVGMTDRTFQTGLRELLSKNFLAPRQPNVFWVNPSLFFKGNRVLFVREYVKRESAQQKKRAALEQAGQQLLIE